MSADHDEQAPADFEGPATARAFAPASASTPASLSGGYTDLEPGRGRSTRSIGAGGAAAVEIWDGSDHEGKAIETECRTSTVSTQRTAGNTSRTPVRFGGLMSFSRADPDLNSNLYTVLLYRPGEKSTRASAMDSCELGDWITTSSDLQNPALREQGSPFFFCVAFPRGETLPWADPDVAEPLARLAGLGVRRLAAPKGRDALVFPPKAMHFGAFARALRHLGLRDFVAFLRRVPLAVPSDDVHVRVAGYVPAHTHFGGGAHFHTRGESSDDEAALKQCELRQAPGATRLIYMPVDVRYVCGKLTAFTRSYLSVECLRYWLELRGVGHGDCRTYEQLVARILAQPPPADPIFDDLPLPTAHAADPTPAVAKQRSSWFEANLRGWFGREPRRIASTSTSAPTPPSAIPKETYASTSPCPNCNALRQLRLVTMEGPNTGRSFYSCGCNARGCFTWADHDQKVVPAPASASSAATVKPRFGGLISFSMMTDMNRFEECYNALLYTPGEKSPRARYPGEVGSWILSSGELRAAALAARDLVSSSFLFCVVFPPGEPRPWADPIVAEPLTMLAASHGVCALQRTPLGRDALVFPPEAMRHGAFVRALEHLGLRDFVAFLRRVRLAMSTPGLGEDGRIRVSHVRVADAMDAKVADTRARGGSSDEGPDDPNAYMHSFLHGTVNRSLMRDYLSTTDLRAWLDLRGVGHGDCRTYEQLVARILAQPPPAVPIFADVEQQQQQQPPPPPAVVAEPIVDSADAPDRSRSHRRGGWTVVEALRRRQERLEREKRQAKESKHAEQARREAEEVAERLAEQLALQERTARAADQLKADKAAVERLARQSQWGKARALVDSILAREPDCLPTRALRLRCLAGLGLFAEVVREVDEELLPRAAGAQDSAAVEAALERRAQALRQAAELEAAAGRDLERAEGGPGAETVVDGAPRSAEEGPRASRETPADAVTYTALSDLAPPQPPAPPLVLCCEDECGRPIRADEEQVAVECSRECDAAFMHKTCWNKFKRDRGRRVAGVPCPGPSCAGEIRGAEVLRRRDDGAQPRRRRAAAPVAVGADSPPSAAVASPAPQAPAPAPSPPLPAPRPRERAPPPQQPGQCAICQKQFNGEAQMMQHLESEGHKKRAARARQRLLAPPPDPPRPALLPLPAAFPKLSLLSAAAAPFFPPAYRPRSPPPPPVVPPLASTSSSSSPTAASDAPRPVPPPYRPPLQTPTRTQEAPAPPSPPPPAPASGPPPAALPPRPTRPYLPPGIRMQPSFTKSAPPPPASAPTLPSSASSTPQRTVPRPYMPPCMRTSPSALLQAAAVPPVPTPTLSTPAPPPPEEGYDSSEEPEGYNVSECSVCLSRVASVRFDPCGHERACVACVESMRSSYFLEFGPNCPWCRRRVASCSQVRPEADYVPPPPCSRCVGLRRPAPRDAQVLFRPCGHRELCYRCVRELEAAGGGRLAGCPAAGCGREADWYGPPHAAAAAAADGDTDGVEL